jgi:hypothetical protein
MERPMPPEQIFAVTSPLAMLGWMALVLAPLAPRITDMIAALTIPVLLSITYTGLILVHWSDAPGGFDSLASVMALFTEPAVALAGWVHYLAFDLFVGAWITRTARAEGICHLLILPCLVLTFLFGPAGFLAFTALRTAFAAQARMLKGAA